MERLSQLFNATPHKSSILVPCEIVPGHADNRYVHVSLPRVGGVARLQDNGEPVPDSPSDKVELNVCPQCWNQFVYDLTKVAQEVNVR